LSAMLVAPSASGGPTRSLVGLAVFCISLLCRSSVEILRGMGKSMLPMRASAGAVAAFSDGSRSASNAPEALAEMAETLLTSSCSAVAVLPLLCRVELVTLKPPLFTPHPISSNAAVREPGGSAAVRAAGGTNGITLVSFAWRFLEKRQTTGRTTNRSRKKDMPMAIRIQADSQGKP